MSMCMCSGCDGFVDSDDDPDCFVGKADRVLCERCRDEEAEEPGSDSARLYGCTCKHVGLGGNDPDGRIVTHRECPLHGVDPDWMRDKARENRP